MKKFISAIEGSVKKQWRVLLVVISLNIVSCISFFVHYKAHLSFEKMNIGDFLFWNLRGMPWAEQLGKVIIPNGYWLAINLLLAVMIGRRFEDMTGTVEVQRILRIGSRKIWWRQKDKECIVDVLIYYTILLLSIIFTALFMKGLFERPHTELVEEYGGESFENIWLFFAAILIMILASLTISVVQALLTVVVDIKIGFVWVSLVLVFAIYTKSRWSIGNGLMMIRLSQLRINDYFASIFLYAALIGLTYGAGGFLVKKIDFIKRESIGDKHVRRDKKCK